jgi:hypothetical protein
MMSPRLNGTGQHQRKNIPLGLVALLMALLGASAPGWAQATGATQAADDTSAAMPSASVQADSVPADSMRLEGALAESVQSDSAGRASRDTTPARPRPPVDSVLGAACLDSQGSAPDLLIVTFRAAATARERAAVAAEVGGELVGMSEHAAPGSWYLRVPGGAADPSVADRLIMLSPVVEVGATRCPS